MDRTRRTEVQQPPTGRAATPYRCEPQSRSNVRSGDLGHINVLDPRQGTTSAYRPWTKLMPAGFHYGNTRSYVDIPNGNSTAARTCWHWRKPKPKSALVDRDFHRKSTRGRKRHARFLSGPMLIHSAGEGPDESAHWNCGAGATADFYERRRVPPKRPILAMTMLFRYSKQTSIYRIRSPALRFPEEIHLRRRKHECNDGLLGTSVGQISVVHCGSKTYPGVLG